MEISAKDIQRAQKKASERAIELNRALGLEYLTVKKGNLVRIDAKGNEHILRKPVFGIRHVKTRKINLNEQDKKV